MQIGPTEIIDAAAEAFRAYYTRVIVSAADLEWLDAALASFCGYGTSVIGCDCEIARERPLERTETPDGCPSASVMAFARTEEGLARAVANRVGQGLLTCPTATVYDGLDGSERRLPMGDHIRYFGDGAEWFDDAFGSWQVPTMEGDWLVPATVGVARGVAGGTLILQGADEDTALAAARRASQALAHLAGVITPFPGGVCRSGSKVGATYRGLIASTNKPYCPTLRNQVESKLVDGAECAYEIVIDGIDEPTVRTAMAEAMRAAAGEGLLAITSSEFGGRLGKLRIPLHEVLS